MTVFQQEYQVGASKQLVFPLINEACGFLESQDMPSANIETFRLALEELLMNICYHSGLREEDLVNVALAFDGNSMRLQVSDSGIAFDPVSASEPNTSLSVQERAIGGLGIYLIRKTSSEFLYRREGGKNIVDVRWEMNSAD
ncbi:MAG: ATP-binding protein [Verrucomicrobiota bacterium]